jgi:hypothetical protein
VGGILATLTRLDNTVTRVDNTMMRLDNKINNLMASGHMGARVRVQGAAKRMPFNTLAMLQRLAVEPFNAHR